MSHDMEGSPDAEILKTAIWDVGIDVQRLTKAVGPSEQGISMGDARTLTDAVSEISNQFTQALREAGSDSDTLNFIGVSIKEGLASIAASLEDIALAIREHQQ